MRAFKAKIQIIFKYYKQHAREIINGLSHILFLIKLYNNDSYIYI